MTKAFSALSALAFTVSLPFVITNYWQTSIYKGLIPPQLEFVDLIYHDGTTSGFIEGCGVAIFRLTDEVLHNIQASGLSYLDSDLNGRDRSGNGKYEPWKNTPATNEEWLFRGATCASDPPSILEQAQRAASEKGAFYTTGHEKDLVVVPSLGLLVLSHDG
jgi:hypothetical protein